MNDECRRLSALPRRPFSRTSGVAGPGGARACGCGALLPRQDARWSNHERRHDELGREGWVSDRNGYRYQPHHPITGAPWPAIPEDLIEIWRRFGERGDTPDACLVNLYRGNSCMSLHQDRDERDFGAPVVSVSLGDTALFRLGGLDRRDPTRSLRLASGDICVLAGPSRLAFHGVDRILIGSSRLIPGGGRLNLTLRLAT